MPEDLGKQIGGLWGKFRDKAADVVNKQSGGLIRGRVAAHDVRDDAGALLVGAGLVIDDGVIERATAAGKMSALVAAAAAAQGQDLKERLQGELDRTPEGQGRRSMADSDEYIEARNYIRYRAAIEVTDIRGAVIVPAGAEITDEDVRRVREAGQLAALIYSAQQSGPPTQEQLLQTPQPQPTNYVPRRTAVPLADSFDEDPSA